MLPDPQITVRSTAFGLNLIRERIVCTLSELNGGEIAGQATNATETPELIRKVSPDVLVLEIRMLGGNGIDLLREIRRDNPVLLIIVLTGISERLYQKVCLTAGADYIFVKTTGLEKMLKVIEWLLTTAPQRPGREKPDQRGTQSNFRLLHSE